jgi:hypothetical protein
MVQDSISNQLLTLIEFRVDELASLLVLELHTVLKKIPEPLKVPRESPLELVWGEVFGI